MRSRIAAESGEKANFARGNKENTQVAVVKSLRDLETANIFVFRQLVNKAIGEPYEMTPALYLKLKDILEEHGISETELLEIIDSASNSKTSPFTTVVRKH